MAQFLLLPPVRNRLLAVPPSDHRAMPKSKPEFAVSGHTEAKCLIYGLFLLRQSLA